jgi:hypothetical protein
MAQRFAGRTGRTAVPYRIVVRGEIGNAPAGPLERLIVESADGESIIACDVVDQAQLRGILSWLGDLGIEIVSVNPVQQEPGL